jgi:general secretion pathway protein G
MNSIEKRRRMAGQGGFTLIELLVVIAILAVLAGVVVFAVGGINNTSTASACKTEARTLKTGVQAFYAQTTQWPTADTSPTGVAGKTFVPDIIESPTASLKYVTLDYTKLPTNSTTNQAYGWTAKCTAAGLTAADLGY